MDKTLFVFYTASKNSSWRYNLPVGWSVVGSGSTSAINGKKLKYEREEQFQGPANNQKSTIQYLDTFFNVLKNNGEIKYFKIRQSYLP
jgi:hypothetical protein